MSEKTPAQAKIEELEARRKARREELERKTEARLAIDLEAVDAAEAQYGAERVAVARLAFVSEDLPVRVVVRAPEPVEMDRYRDTVRDRGNPNNKNFRKGDTLRGAEEIADVTRVYPDEATWHRLAEAFPAMRGQCGALAVDLGALDEEAEGKG